MTKIAHPIFVTGIPRSRSSMTAGILSICGAWGGDMFLQGDQNNPKGYFENRYIRDNILKPWIVRFKGDPLGQDPLPDINDVLAVCKGHSGLHRELRSQVETAIVKQGYKGGPWFYKGLKMCLVWPLWVDAFPFAKWIVVDRDTNEIVESCLKTSFMRRYRNREGWREWIGQYRMRLAEMQFNALDIKTINTSKIIDRDYSEIKEVVKWAGLKWQQDLVDEWVDPGLTRVVI